MDDLATPTAWVPQSKPFCAQTGAWDGEKQPNVFEVKYYSNGARRYDAAPVSGRSSSVRPRHPNYLSGVNPVSGVYGGRMVDLGRMHVYAWDARPYPAFRRNSTSGAMARVAAGTHWLNGRLAGGPLAATVARILRDYGFADYDAGTIEGSVPGYVVDRVMSAREALQPLELAYLLIDVLRPAVASCSASAAPSRASAAINAEGLVESTRRGAAHAERAGETEPPARRRSAHLGRGRLASGRGGGASPGADGLVAQAVFDRARGRGR